MFFPGAQSKAWYIKLGHLLAQLSPLATYIPCGIESTFILIILKLLFNLLNFRLGVNVVSADKILNPVVKNAEVRGFDETILEAVRNKMGWEKPSLEGRHISDPRNNMWGI